MLLLAKLKLTTQRKRNMESILKALYGLDVEFCSNPVPADAGYKEALQEANAMREELKDTLSSKEYALLEKLLDREADAYSHDLFAYFKDGFCKGMRIMAEAMQGT